MLDVYACKLDKSYSGKTPQQVKKTSKKDTKAIIHFKI